jgi:hypothetical protein
MHCGHQLSLHLLSFYTQGITEFFKYGYSIQRSLNRMLIDASAFRYAEFKRCIYSLNDPEGAIILRPSWMLPGSNEFLC